MPSPAEHDSDAISPATSRRTTLAFLGVWTVFALLSAAQSATRVQGPINWSSLLTDRFADWYTCALFTPAYFWLAARDPVTGPQWLRNSVVHLGATQLFVVLKYAAYVGISVAIGQQAFTGSLAAAITRMIVGNIFYENMAFWALDLGIHALAFYRDARTRELRAERLRTELTQARLDSLTGQLHPHFLFNALNSVSSLMHYDVAAADVLLARLGDLLRRTLRASERPEVTLAEELALLSDYLAIVGARFRDRLTVRINAAEGTERSLVPHFILQPIVENALEHGIGRRSGAGTIEVRAIQHADGETLELLVLDDGTGLASRRSHIASKRETNEKGVGLSNTRRRLDALYGDRGKLVLSDRASGGVEARLQLPFRTAASAR